MKYMNSVTTGNIDANEILCMVGDTGVSAPTAAILFKVRLDHRSKTKIVETNKNSRKI